MKNFDIMKTKKNIREDGFFMLQTILFITVMLVIALAVLDIAMKQFVTVRINKESPRAFYAADTGLECVMYYDLIENKFSTGTPSGFDLCKNGSGSGQNKDITLVHNWNQTNDDAYYSAYGEYPPVEWDPIVLRFGNNDDDLVCTKVTVTKLRAGTELARAIIESTGYNTDCPPPDGTPKRQPLIERGIRVQY